VSDRAPGGVGQVHADEDVAGDADAVDDLALGVLDLNHFFHGHLDFEDVIFHVQGLDAGFEVGLHAVFVTGVGVDDVPVTFLAAQLGLEFLGGIGGRGGGSSGEGVTGLIVTGVPFNSCSVGEGVPGFGRGGLNPRLVAGFCRDVRGLFQLSLGYPELLLRHLVSCFLIA